MKHAVTAYVRLLSPIFVFTYHVIWNYTHGFGTGKNTTR